MRRLISDAVQVRPPQLTQMDLVDEQVDVAARLLRKMPTDSEVREALLKLAAQMKDTVSKRTAGQEGWIVGDMEFQLVDLDLGEIALRGSVIIERSDA